MLTIVDDRVLAALKVGARGYLLKGAVQEEVLAAIRAVAAGGAIFGPGLAQRVLSGGRDCRQRYSEQLTEREAQVLALIADGRAQASVGPPAAVGLRPARSAG